MRVAIKTLGCKVNQSESDLLASLLMKENIIMVDFKEEADCYIINSCAVTGMSEKKTRQWIRRALRNNQNSRVFLLGCYSRLLSQEIPSFDPRLQIIDSTNKIQETLKRLGLSQNNPSSMEVVLETKRARVWLKIEDGCDRFCHYCIVPHLRGRVRSEEPQQIIAQVVQLERKGIHEIVLSGINLGMYGKESGKTSLIELLEQLVKRTQSIRFRLSSIEPFLIDKNFLDRYFSLIPRVCPHFHIPLQNGSDQILSKMGRGYTTENYQELIHTIRNYDPRIAISTDVIVGFPGESDQHFSDTVEFSRAMSFSRAHIFIYSARPFTPAAQWEKIEGVPYQIKKERERILHKTVQGTQLTYYRSFIGEKLLVLVESFKDDRVGSGYSENYIPVRCDPTSSSDYGRIIPVMIEREDNRILVGKIEKN